MIAQDARTLITGASGFLGSYLERGLRAAGTLAGTCCRRQGGTRMLLELTDARSVRQVVRRFGPDLVIHCAGMTRPDECELDRRRAYATNVVGTLNLLDATLSPMIYISTDYVFDGERGNYGEDDTVNPINYYGETKVEAERCVLGASTDNVVIRVAGLYGANEDNNEFVLSLTSARTIRRATDLIGSYTFLGDVAAAVQSLPADCSGIYHVVGGPPTSRYAFALEAAQLLRLRVRVDPVLASDYGYVARRPRNVGLISRRQLVSTHSIEEGLRETARQVRSLSRRPPTDQPAN